MFNNLWIVPALPFAGFLILAFIGKKLPKQFNALIGAGSIGLSAIITIIIGIVFISSPPSGIYLIRSYGHGLVYQDFRPKFLFISMH